MQLPTRLWGGDGGRPPPAAESLREPRLFGREEAAEVAADEAAAAAGRAPSGAPGAAAGPFHENLRELRDGRIGRMLVRQSGRVQLVLGDGPADAADGARAPHVFDVDRGLQCAFKQSVVAVTLDDADAAADGADGARAVGSGAGDAEGELSVIGDITQRVVVVPTGFWQER